MHSRPPFLSNALLKQQAPHTVSSMAVASTTRAADMSVSPSSAASGSRVSSFLLILTTSLAISPVGVADGVTNTTKKLFPVRHQLSLDFYSKTCPQLEHLVGSVTSQRFHVSPASGPATIRLFFHDCFGCDASILISAGGGGSSSGKVERDVEDNMNLSPAGFEMVSFAKAAVESKCPGVVSCADILAIAARDFVHLAGGPYYQVKKGRKDSRVSLAYKVSSNLPRPNSTVDELLHLFATKGLSQEDLVALSGAHTIGFSHCDRFLNRLYNHRHTGKPDPSMDTRLLKALQMSCPPFGGNIDIVAPFDVQTPFLFDRMYYGNLEAGMGLLASDQALFLDPRTRPLVQAMGKDKGRFFEAFADGMQRMGSIRVKKGKKGEIRKDCSRHLSTS